MKRYVNVDRVSRRKKRVSANIKGTSQVPRITVFRSNRYVYAQAIDDSVAKTIAWSSSKDAEGKKSDQAKKAGLIMAKKLIEKKISKAVFDRNKFSYLGRVRSFCEGVREGGINI